MAISARGKATFLTTALGSAVSLVMSIGFIYLTLPTTSGLILAAFSCAAAAYLGGLILYNVFMLQNEKSKIESKQLDESRKSGSEKAQNSTDSEYQMKKNRIKAYVFAFFTAACTLMVAATSAVTTYQSGILLGQSLSFSPQLFSGFSIAFSIILGLGVVLGGYDQTRKFFFLIKGEKTKIQESEYLPIPESQNRKFSVVSNYPKIADKTYNKSGRFFKKVPEHSVLDEKQITRGRTFSAP